MPPSAYSQLTETEREARRRANSRRRRHLAYGTWQPLVDAEPARTHVRNLMAYGIGWERIATLAGVPGGTVEKLLYGCRPRGQAPSKRIRPETAQRLLAVQPELRHLGDVALTDGTGTRRRLQALVARGFTLSFLARRLGQDPSNFAKTVRQQRVYAATARATIALYDELSLADPAGHGVSPARAERARRYAAEHCWAPVGAWDEDTIDDPEAFPDWTGKCGTPRGDAAHRYYRILPVCQPCRDALVAERRKEAA